MRKSKALASLLVAVSLVATGCGVSGGPEKTFKKAANERMDHQLELFEIADTYQNGDSEKAEESAREWADDFNKIQAEYVCRKERTTLDSDDVYGAIKVLRPSDVPNEDGRKEIKKSTKDALKDLEKSDDSDDEAYVKSEHEDFEDLFGGSRVYMQKEDGDWKICDDSMSQGSGLM